MKLSVTAVAIMALGLLQTSCSRDKVLGLVNLSSSTPEGKVITRTYDFREISSVDVSSGIYVFYTSAPVAEPVKVVGPEDVLEVLTVKCDSDGELELGFEGRKRFNFAKESDHVKVCLLYTSPSPRD